jgi:LysM repeat protein
MACALNGCKETPFVPAPASIEAVRPQRPVVAPVREENVQEVTITTVEGESLSWLAQQLGVPVGRLRTDNPTVAEKPPAGTALTLRAPVSRQGRLAAERERIRLAREARDLKYRTHVGNEAIKVRPGDSWKSMRRRYGEPPLWLVKRINPNANLERLVAGTSLLMPVLVKPTDPKPVIGQFFAENRVKTAPKATHAATKKGDKRKAAGPANARPPRR